MVGRQGAALDPTAFGKNGGKTQGKRPAVGRDCPTRLSLREAVFWVAINPSLTLSVNNTSCYPAAFYSCR